MVNTCAFIEAARQESIDTVLALSEARQAGARLVVTGCMAERYGDELAAALPEVDLVAPFGASLTGPGRDPKAAGTPVALGRKPPVLVDDRPVPSFDLLNLPRPAAYGPLVLHQDRRRVRPELRVLRHPLVPRASSGPDPIASILAEVDELGGAGPVAP